MVLTIVSAGLSGHGRSRTQATPQGRRPLGSEVRRDTDRRLLSRFQPHPPGSQRPAPCDAPAGSPGAAAGRGHLCARGRTQRPGRLGTAPVRRGQVRGSWRPGRRRPQHSPRRRYEREPQRDARPRQAARPASPPRPARRRDLAAGRPTHVPERDRSVRGGSEAISASGASNTAAGRGGAGAGPRGRGWAAEGAGRAGPGRAGPSGVGDRCATVSFPSPVRCRLLGATTGADGANALSS